MAVTGQENTNAQQLADGVAFVDDDPDLSRDFLVVKPGYG